MISMTKLRERANAAMHRAERAGKTDPTKELHQAFTSAFPAAPSTLNATTKSDTIPQKDDKPEIITHVTITSNTTTAGAYYTAEILNHLSKENR